MELNILTNEDVDEIQERIESFACPHCGGYFRVNLYLNNDVVSYNAKEICCEKRKSSFALEVNNEIANQIGLKANRTLG